MLYLILAILSSTMVQFVMRLSTDKVTNNSSMLAVNYAVCMLIAGAYMGFGNLIPAGPKFGSALGLGALQGLIYLAAFVLLQYNDKRNGVVLSASFMKLGLLVPMAISIIFFHEQPGIFHIIGFVVAIAAILTINYEPKSAARAGSMASLIALLLVGGLVDVMAKIFQELGNPDHAEQFLFYTFAAALVLSLVMVLRKKERPGKAELFYGTLVAIPNFFSSKFLLAALTELDAIIVLPSYNVGTILLATLAGIIVFHEKLKKHQWAAIAAIVVALALLNL